MVAELRTFAPAEGRWQLGYDAVLIQVYHNDRTTVVAPFQEFNGPFSPNPNTFWVEGLAPTDGTSVVFSVDLDGDGPSVACSDIVLLTVSQLEILDRTMGPADHVSIGHWGDDRGVNELTGYTSGLSGTALNDSGGTFIDGDPDRFTVRLTHHPGNVNPGSVETVSLGLATLDGGGAVDDAQHAVTLLETGANTGVFVSESQLLTAPDLSMVEATDQDDGFAVYSARAMAAVADEGDDDRTHKAMIDGHVRATYTGLGGDFDLSVPVCDRVPIDERKEVRIRVHVFNEPFDDMGYDHDNDPGTPDAGAGNGVFDFTDLNGNGTHDSGEPSEPYTSISPDGARNTVLGSVADATNHVAAQIERANFAWAQGCIKVSQVGGILFEEAPVNSSGANILNDRDFDTDIDEEVVILNPAGVTYDMLEVYFVARIEDPPANALANTPALRGGVAIPPALEESSYVFIGLTHGAPPLTDTPLDVRFRTLAHELGHALTNQGDRPNPQYIFFHATTTYDDPIPNTYRRIRHDTESAARTCRPAGNLTATGNRLISGCP